MNKNIKLAFVLFLIVFLIACTPKHYYLKPELHGQLIDKNTEKPIANKDGYIGYSLGEDRTVKTDDQGNFKITPKEESYYFFRPNLKKISASAPYIYIYFDGYDPKSFDYSNGKMVNKIEYNSGATELEKGDVGVVYLTPKKII